MFWLLPLQHRIRLLKGAGRRALAYERLMIFIKLQRGMDARKDLLEMLPLLASSPQLELHPLRMIG